MKTIVYIDGFNFYYGCLKNSSYKWLDIYKLFNEYIIPSSLPNYDSLDSCQVKYFTTPIVEKAANSIDSVSSQNKYLRALKLLYDDSKLTIINGRYAINTKPAYTLINGVPIKQSPKVDVWYIEEKQTDVNIALEMYRDSIRGNVDNLILCSNDSDIAPALKMIKKDTSDINLGLVAPFFKKSSGLDNKRSPNRVLLKYIDWKRLGITEAELIESQLPDFIPAKRKGVHKPSSWSLNKE